MWGFHTKGCVSPLSTPLLCLPQGPTKDSARGIWQVFPKSLRPNPPPPDAIWAPLVIRFQVLDSDQFLAGNSLHWVVGWRQTYWDQNNQDDNKELGFWD